MNQIATIVNLVLENHDGSCLDNEAERDHIANAIASKLTLASLQQLADLLGGTVEPDINGQAVIRTNIRLHDVAGDLCGV